MLVIIMRIKRRLNQFIKMVLALAILVILVTQLIGVIDQASQSYRRWQNRENPHGNPLKVYLETDPVTVDPDDRIFVKLKKYYRTYKPAE
ncbi:MAG: hypothetical protein ACOY30_09180 [Bacillota bacterium]